MSSRSFPGTLAHFLAHRRFEYPNAGHLYGAPIYPGNGYPPRPGEDRPGLSPFGRLAMGQALGKSSILIYDGSQSKVQASPVNMITVEGDDLDAWQQVITLHPPRVIPLPFEDVLAQFNGQNTTGEVDNSEVSDDNFPDTTAPIQWPPLEALIEFGVGGASTQVVVDYINGVTLAVVASYVRVQALITQSEESGGIQGTSAAYYLAAHIGPGFAETHARRTIYVGTVQNAAASGVYAVPKFGKRATLVGRVEPANPVPVATSGWIRFWQSPDGSNGVGDLFFPSSGVTVEVPNGAQYFSVFNQSGSAMKMNVMFSLGF